ncbi:Rho guanine nucleotide exchange factor gef1, partial [Fusarium globosum]
MDNDMDKALHAGLQADVQDVDSGFRNPNLEPHHDLHHLSQHNKNQRPYDHDNDHNRRIGHTTDLGQDYLNDQLSHDRRHYLPDSSPSAPPASHFDQRSASSRPPVPHADEYDSISTGAHHAFAPVNPDDFYKSYRGTYHNNQESLSIGASALRPSLRSNGDGLTPKLHITSQTEINMRSTSNPVDNRPALPGYKPTGTHPSVRDLKRRFDQNGAAPSSIPRAPAHTGAAAKIRQDVGVSPQPRNGATSYSTLRDGSNSFSKQTMSSSARSQRSRYVAEDQVSNNSQSFASRIGKPRSTTSGNSNASKPTSNLAPESPPQQPTSSSISPTPSRSQGLLFGEILPEQHNFPTAGYGIEGVRPRRTSESSLHHPFSHQRSLSDPPDVAEPSSPSIWYRSLNGHDNNGQPTQAPQKGHTRSHSDIPKSPSVPPVSRKTPSRKSPTTNTSSAGSASKLPRSVRKVNSPSDSTPSTRSNSPAFKRPQVNGRTSRAGNPTTRAKTPTQSGVTRKAAPRTLVTPTNNNRLQANIIAPPPKLSPPLRSSRPRQPVSVATTASSRMRAVERARSPNPTSIPQSRIAEPSSRRRKISVGPIDFEQRREHIRLAYTKSIRESQALEARQKAVDRRRREMEAAARAKATATTSSNSNSPSVTPEPNATESPIPADIPPVPLLPDDHLVSSEFRIGSGPSLSPEVSSTTEVQNALNVADLSDTLAFPGSHEVSYDQPDGEPRRDQPSPFLDDPTMSPVDIAMALPPASLMLTATSQATFTDESSAQDFDSPTLGVPGSFPALSPPIGEPERPPTADSIASETTEFDNEPQITPPRSSQTPLEVPITVVKPPSPQAQKSASPPKAEYHYPFEDDPDSPVRPKSASSTVDVAEHALSKHDEVITPFIPGAFDIQAKADVPQPGVESYKTTITVLPPSDEPRAAESLEETVPFPRIEPQYESDCHSDSEYDEATRQYRRFHDDDAITDSCTEDAEEADRNDCRSEVPSDDQFSSHRASTCESLDINNEPHHAYDEQQRPEISTNLM